VTPEILKAELAELGYTANMEILDASCFGVPQRRNRVIFLAYKSDKKKPEFPTPIENEKKVTLGEAISDLVSRTRNKRFKHTEFQKNSLNGRTPSISGKPVALEGDYLNNELPNHSNIIVERFSLYKEGEDSATIKRRIKKEGISLDGKKALINLCAVGLGITADDVVAAYENDVTDEMIEVLMTKKNMRRKLEKNSVSPTVVTLPDDYISPYESRTFSVRELARLQSFDDSFEFLGKRTTGGPRRRVEVPQYSQVGNAVPPLLARAVAIEIIKVLK
ncbi:MAG: DNA cytosine methyltransferase, partial [Lachnospiraceae bacterium]